MTDGSRRPTDAELEILNILWERGPSTVRDVHEALGAERKTGYTTTLKLMQIMAEKGLVRRDESQRAHVYHPALSRERTLRRIARDVMERVFEGSAETLMLHALRAKNVSEKELKKIRRMLEEYTPHDDRD